ncbi:DUF3263 domain-containing protein [Streptomyces gamaensis]|uniref:DUF3263 domain-containing protein n=1 Tax=Streptomyces gamaensis TaxID=1763542 RepID=A0ABW0Z630_9ACTN
MAPTGTLSDEDLLILATAARYAPARVPVMAVAEIGITHTAFAQQLLGLLRDPLAWQADPITCRRWQTYLDHKRAVRDSRHPDDRTSASHR